MKKTKTCIILKRMEYYLPNDFLNLNRTLCLQCASQNGPNLVVGTKKDLQIKTTKPLVKGNNFGLFCSE